MSSRFPGPPVPRSAGPPVPRSAGPPVPRSAGLPVSRSPGQPVSRSAGSPVSRGTYRPVSGDRPVGQKKRRNPVKGRKILFVRYPLNPASRFFWLIRYWFFWRSRLFSQNFRPEFFWPILLGIFGTCAHATHFITCLCGFTHFGNGLVPGGCRG